MKSTNIFLVYVGFVCASDLKAQNSESLKNNISPKTGIVVSSPDEISLIDVLKSQNQSGLVGNYVKNLLIKIEELRNPKEDLKKELTVEERKDNFVLRDNVTSMLIGMVRAEVLARTDPEQLSKEQRVSAGHAIFTKTGNQIQESIDIKLAEHAKNAGNPEFKPTEKQLSGIKDFINSRLEQYSAQYLGPRTKSEESNKLFLDSVKDAASKAIDQYLADNLKAQKNHSNK